MEKKIISKTNKKVPWRSFLKDVFICSLGSYGGPEAHFGVFIDQLVIKKKYLTEEEMGEFIALTTILPGPSSTQTIVAIGQKVGGPWLGFWTMIVWSLPVLIFMTILSFIGRAPDFIIREENLRFIGPMAVGFIVLAAYRIMRKNVKDNITLALFLITAIITYFNREPWVFPLLLFVGGAISVLTTKEKDIWNRIQLQPPWKYLIAFILFAIGSMVLSFLTGNIIVKLFESFYRYGYLVIGGGQVVVPLMLSELVDINHYMTNQEFLTGYGLVQGLPGPMFSFSAYAGGMAARGGTVFHQIAGAMAGGIGIFLPGILLIYFVYPIWEGLKKIRGIKISLRGITAVAGGLIVSAAVLLMQKSGFILENIIIMIITIALLSTKRIPAPIIVLLTLIAGFLF